MAEVKYSSLARELRRWFPLSGLSFSHSVALNDRSENPKSKATIDQLLVDYWWAAHSSKTPENLE